MRPGGRARNKPLRVTSMESDPRTTGPSCELSRRPASVERALMAPNWRHPSTRRASSLPSVSSSLEADGESRWRPSSSPAN